MIDTPNPHELDGLLSPRVSEFLRVPARLTIIIPTLNERDNVRLVYQAVSRALEGVDWEIIFVDDNSQDGTYDALVDTAKIDSRVRVIRRFRRRGLSSAFMEGVLASTAEIIAIMDADLQHDENLLPLMYADIKGGGSEIVVASRYMAGGDLGEIGVIRRLGSRYMSWVGQKFLGLHITDPMSGFFMLKRELFDEALTRLSGIGFKILVDIIASVSRPLRIKERPYTFRERRHGVSKLDSLVVWEYIQLLLDKKIGRIVSVRFLSYGLLGGVGLFLHLITLATLYKAMNVSFIKAQIAAILVAMTCNFFLNNLLTYRDLRFKGWRELVSGLVGFYFLCAIGALTNLGLSSYIFENGIPWYIAGLAGALVGAVWNYSSTRAVLWHRNI